MLHLNVTLIDIECQFDIGKQSGKCDYLQVPELEKQLKVNVFRHWSSMVSTEEMSDTHIVLTFLDVVF